MGMDVTTVFERVCGVRVYLCGCPGENVHECVFVCMGGVGVLARI